MPGVPLNDGADVRAPRYLDLRQGTLNGSVSVPYATANDILTAVPDTRKAEGLPFYVQGPNNTVETWRLAKDTFGNWITVKDDNSVNNNVWVYKGAYVHGTQYHKNDVVYHWGSSFIALVDNINIHPANGATWGTIADRGLDSVGMQYSALTENSANDYSATFSPPFNGLSEGVVVKMKFPTANTGATTVTVDSNATRNLVLPGDGALSGGEIAAGGIYPVAFTATALQLIGGVGGGSISEKIQTHTSGATVTISDDTTWLIVNPATTLPALDITLSNPAKIRNLTISFGGTITSGDVVTAITTTAASGWAIVDASTLLNVEAGETIEYMMDPTLKKAFRI